jgi:hypothetical protein
MIETSLIAQREAVLIITTMNETPEKDDMQPAFETDPRFSIRISERRMAQACCGFVADNTIIPFSAGLSRIQGSGPVWRGDRSRT